MYPYQCPICGANLDPGERCDCLEPEEDEKETMPASTASNP